MTQREVLLKRIQVCDFALTDTSLYLDNHPNDKQALAFYKKHMDMKAKAQKEYVEKYGPIDQMDHYEGDRWKWVDGPWPWQNEEDMKNV